MERTAQIAGRSPQRADAAGLRDSRVHGSPDAPESGPTHGSRPRHGCTRGWAPGLHALPRRAEMAPPGQPRRHIRTYWDRSGLSTLAVRLPTLPVQHQPCSPGWLAARAGAKAPRDAPVRRPLIVASEPTSVMLLGHWDVRLVPALPVTGFEPRVRLLTHHAVDLEPRILLKPQIALVRSGRESATSQVQQVVCCSGDTLWLSATWLPNRWRAFTARGVAGLAPSRHAHHRAVRKAASGGGRCGARNRPVRGQVVRVMARSANPESEATMR
jgi:hypothetical protein